MVDDFINGNRVSLENPRWINKIGYVNKLHPAHENEGQEIKFNPLKICENECYFVRHMRCIQHDNREDGYTTLLGYRCFWGKKRRFRTHVLLLTGRYFRVEWHHYFAKE